MWCRISQTFIESVIVETALTLPQVHLSSTRSTQSDSGRGVGQSRSNLIRQGYTHVFCIQLENEDIRNFFTQAKVINFQRQQLSLVPSCLQRRLPKVPSSRTSLRCPESVRPVVRLKSVLGRQELEQEQDPPFPVVGSVGSGDKEVTFPHDRSPCTVFGRYRHVQCSGTGVLTLSDPNGQCTSSSVKWNPRGQKGIDTSNKH